MFQSMAGIPSISTPVHTPSYPNDHLKGTSTMSALATANPPAIDLRTITPRERHARVFSRVDALQPGQSLQLLNDHDPQPLRVQLDARASGQFGWAPLESGPTVWRVQITRIGGKPIPAATDSCCSGGACCG